MNLFLLFLINFNKKYIKTVDFSNQTTNLFYVYTS